MTVISIGNELDKWINPCKWPFILWAPPSSFSLWFYLPWISIIPSVLAKNFTTCGLFCTMFCKFHVIFPWPHFMTGTIGCVWLWWWWRWWTAISWTKKTSHWRRDTIDDEVPIMTLWWLFYSLLVFISSTFTKFWFYKVINTELNRPYGFV